MPDPTCTAQRHGGTVHFYKKHGCRCPAARAAKAAESQRWPRPKPEPQPPIVDPVAVARACLGDRTIRLTPGERATAIGRLTDRGRSQRWIADQLGIHTRTVARHRANIRTAA